MKKKNVQSQTLNLIPFENLLQDHNIFVRHRSLTDLTQPEQFCEEEWANIAPSQCTNWLKNDAERLQAIVEVSICFNQVVTKMNEYFKVMIFQFSVIISWLMISFFCHGIMQRNMSLR